MFMRRHIIAPILLLGTVIIGVLYAPAATAVSKDDIINGAKRESAIATLCGHGAFLRSPDVGSSYSIKDFFSSAGDLSGIVEVAGAINTLAGRSEGSLREFMLGLGYTWDSAQSRHVPPRADVFCNNLVTKYNSGRKPDANSPKVRWGRAISALSDTCQLQRLGTVTSLRGSQDHKIELAKTNGEDRDGWTYAIMKDVSDDGSSIVDTVVMVDLKDSVSYDTICVQFTKEASSNVTAVLEEIQAGASKTRAKVIANELCAPLKDTNPNDYNNCINETQKKAAPCFQSGGDDMEKIITCLRQSFPRDRNKITEELIKKAIGAASATLTGGSDNSGGGSEDDGPECALEGGVGWLVCPAMTFIAGLSDGAYGLISMMLDIEPMLLNTDARKSEGVATYTAWGVFRNMANIAFIIVFLIVIFSQVSNVGISNYGIKRIMPRLIIGAILINASFFISQLAVDLSNIAGSSLKELLEVAGGNAIRNTPPPSAATIAGGILSGSLMVGVAILAGVAIGLPGLLMFLLTILITLLILIGRQAGVVLLVAISPLAFASWILPNTEQWFKKWQKMLLGLLLVYPAVALLFGAGKFAAKVLSANGSADGFMQIAALVVSALPLIATPSLLKGSMNALGTIGAKFGNLGSSTMSSLNKKRMETSKEKRANLRNGFMKRDFSGQGKSRGIIRRTGRAFARGGQKILRYSDQVKRDRKLKTDLLQSDRDQQYKQGLMADHTAGTLGGRLGSAVDTAAGKGMMEKLRSEAIGNVEATLKSSSLSELRDALKQAITSNDSTTAIAAQNQLLKQGSAGISSFEDAMLDYERGGGQMSGEMRQSLATNIRESHAGTMDKNLAVGEWAIGDESMENSRTAAHDKLAANGMTIEKFSALTERSQIELLTSGKAVLSQKQLNNLSYPRGAMAEKVSPAVSAAAKGAVPKP